MNELERSERDSVVKKDIEFPPALPEANLRDLDPYVVGGLDLVAASKLAEPEYSAGLSDQLKLDVSVELALAGKSPLREMEYFAGISNRLAEADKPTHSGKIALLLTALGENHAANSYVVKESHFPDLYAQLALISKFKGAAPYYTESFWERAWEEMSEGIFYHWVGGLARLQSESDHMVDPNNISRLDKQGHHDIVGFASNMAVGYAFAGDPDRAYKRLENIPPGGWHQALEKATALSYIAKSFGKNDEQARRAIDEALGLVGKSLEIAKQKREEEHYARHQQSEVYALLAESAFATGLDPTTFINLAEETLLLEKSNLRSDAYNALLKAKFALGLELKNTTAAALAWADQIVNPGDKEDGWGQVLKFMAYEQIFQSQLKSLEYRGARETLAKMKFIDALDYEIFTEYLVPLLAQLGRTEVTGRPLNLDVNFCEQMP